MVTLSSIPLLVVALPLLGAGFLAWAGRQGANRRNLVANLIACGTALITIYQFMLVQRGNVLIYELPWSLGFGLRWQVDFISAAFAVVVALVWLLATIFADQYMAGERQQTRFFTASLFTLGSTLGVFVAGDLFTLFLFFELMTFAAYLLVIHEESPSALRAGHVYLFMSVIGGLFLLGAIFFIQHVLGTTEFVAALEALVAAGINPWWLFVAIVLGFGVKAGLVPLHIWLPKAHPVAPAPASALLSALMIKTGAYGFLRFLYVYMAAPQNPVLVATQEHFGYVFVWIGALTMLAGALMALLHSPMKRVLAYSSISQMGYILFSLGVGVMLGPRGAFGFAGAWLHMINHAFFKSFLFLLAGAIYLQTGELDLNHLGGLKKQMPRAFFFFLVAAAGITGVPGLNGYVSKVLIHEGILEAYHLKGWPALLWLERIFVFTGGLTAAYISKIWLKTFLGKPKKDWREVKDLSGAHTKIFTVYAAILLGIGLSAQTRVNQLVLPAMGLVPFSAADLAHLQRVPFWSGAELGGPVLAYLIALGALLLSHLFLAKASLPPWFSVEVLFYRPAYSIAQSFFQALKQGAARLGGLRLPRWGIKLSWPPKRRLLGKLKRGWPRWRWDWDWNWDFSWLRAVLQKSLLFFQKLKTLTRQGAVKVAQAMQERTDLVFDTLIIALIFILVVAMILTR